MAETIFARPMIFPRGERIANAYSGAGAILGMNLLLPETNVAGRRRLAIAEKRFEALRPEEAAGGYSPNPNSIIRSLGSARKMFRDFIRAARSVCRSFMGLVDAFLRRPVVVLMRRLGLNFCC